MDDRSPRDVPAPESGDDAAALRARLDRLVAMQELLFDFSREIRPGLELSELVARVLAAMRRLVDFKGGSVSLVEAGLVRLVASDPPVSPEVLRMRVPVGTGLSGRVVTERRSVYSPDITNDPRVPSAYAGLGSNATIRSYLAVPLIVHGEAIGGLQIDSADVDAFSPDDRYVLEGLSAQVAALIDQTRRLGKVSDLERLKDDFMRRVEHELRTPIAILTGFADLLVKDDVPADQRQLAAERIDDAARSLRYLVEEILTLTALDAGDEQIARERVGALGVARAAVAGLDGADDVTVGGEDVDVFADPERLQQVLRALVHNAQRFGAPPVEVVARAGTIGSVTIDVHDRGDGVAEELRPHLFERFTRGTVAAGGLGLGLPTARALVRAMGGDLVHVERDGGGSTFRIVLDAPIA